MGTMLTNYWTTLFGFVNGLASYLLLVGPTWPKSRGEAVALILGALQAGWGYVQKDALTGSRPHP